MAKGTTFKGEAKPFGEEGWFNESTRHSMASKGLKSGNLADTTDFNALIKARERANKVLLNRDIKSEQLAKEPQDIDQTWDALMYYRYKETRTNGIANTLRDDEIETIIANMEFFGASTNMMRQVYSDLKVARFRVFD